jgi:hypothetical protein
MGGGDSCSYFSRRRHKIRKEPYPKMGLGGKMIGEKILWDLIKL